MYPASTAYRVFRLFPVSEASKSLYHLDRFPIIRKSTHSILVRKFLTCFERFRLEEFTTRHDQNREQERRLGPNVIRGVQSWVEKVDERVEPQEHEVKQYFGVRFIQDSRGYRVLQAALRGRDSGLRRR